MSLKRYALLFSVSFLFVTCGSEPDPQQTETKASQTRSAAFTAEDHYLPWPAGKAYRVSRGPKSHDHAKETYSWDFAMPTGTPLVATVDGTIRLAKGSSSTGGCSVSYSSYVNYVILYWADGSGRESQYLHLSKLAPGIKAGKFVKRGTLIGYSGNTGYSCGAHLHYTVQKGATGPNDTRTSWFLYSTFLGFAEINYSLEKTVSLYSKGGSTLTSKNSLQETTNECGDAAGGLFTEEKAMVSSQKATCSRLTYAETNTCAKSLVQGKADSKELYNCSTGQIQICKNSCVSCKAGQHDVCN